ncbi:alkaline phosphatase D family protein [Streptomyces sp. NPDC006132]|uniref:alkaline phosphatase D family protein n=1 Tax=Streptomyces sp. NPDC006132 TaxID=3156732 RepID=UPI0033F01475
MALDVKSVWAGALTPTSVRVIADTAPPTNGSLLVADNEAMTGAVTIGPATASAEGVLAFTVTGLTPDTRYWYVVDAGGLNVSYKGTFRTHPGPVGEPLSYVFGAAGDAGLVGDGDDSYITSAVSDNPVFDTMRAQAAAEEWAWFSHLGDLHYRNINTNTPASFRTAYDDVHNFNLGFNPDARQGKFLRGQAITYVWDDHDFGANDSNRLSASNPAANQVYREVVPHYPLAGGATGIYQSWQVGRVLYIASDCRSFRDPNSDPQGPAKTMLGAGQKTWMANLLATARDGGAEALVWQSSSRWIGGSDTWSSFEHERAEMVEMFGDLGWLNRMIYMTADEHALSICSGPYNPYGHFPMFMFASMDSDYGGNTTEIYDVGQSAGRQRYGTMRVTDHGHTIALTGTGYIDGRVWKAYTKHVHVGGTVIALDYAAAHISDPFEPTDDDQHLRNVFTAKREDGGEYTYALMEGPKSVASAGEYDDSGTLNVATDEQLPDQAAWRVHQGSVDEDRFSSITVDLRGNPELAGQLTRLSFGDRIVIENPPPELPPDTITQVAEGGTTRLSLERWQAEIGTSPGSVWTVAQLPVPLDLSLADGSFEFGVADWTGSNGTFVQSSEQAFRGTYSGKLTVVGAPSQAFVRPVTAKRVPITAGQSYRATMWAYAPAAYSTVSVAIDWRDAAGAYISTSSSIAAIPAGQWTLYTVVATAPANAAFAVYGPTLGANPPAGTVLHVDEVRLREAVATGHSAGPNRPNRLDTSGSHLVSAATPAATTLTVHTPPNGIFDRAPWIISTGLPAAPNLKPTQFPFDLKLGGEVVRVTACAPAVWDSFTRTTASSWGTASSGQAWTNSGGAAADYSTNGSLGVHSLGTVNVSRFSSLLAPGPDVDVRADFASSALAAGGPQYVHLFARSLDVNNQYAARLAFNTNQTITLVIQKRVGGTQTDLASVTIPGVHAAGKFFTLRFQVEGSDLRAMAWERGITAPGRWQATVTDTALTAAGSLGVRSVLASANTNTVPVTISVDNLELTKTQVMTVQRSINTVVKAQAAGTPVSLAQPATVAL